MSTAPNHEGETDTSRERGAQDTISSFLLWVHPRWKCLLTRIRKETTNLLLACKAMWNAKKSLQSWAVLTNQPPASAPGTRHTGVSGETNGILSAGACRGKKRIQGTCSQWDGCKDQFKGSMPTGSLPLKQILRGFLNLNKIHPSKLFKQH